MNTDLQAQLRLLGDWLEDECGAALRSSAVVDSAERDGTIADLTVVSAALNHQPVIDDSRGESAVIQLRDHELTKRLDIARERRWPFIAVGAAAMLAVAIVWSFGNGAGDGNIVTADRQQPAPIAGSQGLGAGSGIGGLGVTTVILADLEGTPVGAETISTEIQASEVVASSIGDIRWTAVSVDPRTLAPILSTAVGFATVTGDGQLLLSDDAVEWRSVVSPFPGSIDQLFQGNEALMILPGNRYFLNTTEEGGDVVQWISTDFVTWSREGLAAAIPRGLDDWINGPEFLDIAFGGLYDVNVETPEGANLTNMIARVDWEALALQAGGDDLRQRLAEGALFAGVSLDSNTGVVDMNLWASSEERGENQDLWPNGPQPQPSGVQFRLSISGDLDGWVVEFEDVATSETLGSIRGSLPGLGPEDAPRSDTTLDDVLTALTSHPGISAFFVSSADGLELVDHPPWVSLPGSWPSFVMSDEYLYAYYDSGSWRSPDGRSWEPLGTDQVPSVHRRVEGPGGVLIAEAFGDLEPGTAGPVILRSEDGIAWAPPGQPPIVVDDGVPVIHLGAADSGFFLISISDQGVVEQWTSVDGDTWERTEPVSELDLSGPDPFGREQQSSNGDVVVITVDGSQGRSTAWIVEIIPTQ